MNKLVQSNRQPKRSTLDRGEAIKPKTTFSLDAAATTTEKVVKPKVDYKPRDTSMKIDTDIRDQINALSLIGVGETQKEVIQIALSDLIDNLPEEQRRAYDNQYETFREKTIRKFNK